MKILMLNTSDSYGGAAIAAYRLHKGLQMLGIQSQMLVQNKYHNDNSIIGPEKRKVLMPIIRSQIDKLPLRIYNKRMNTPWGLAWFMNNSVISRINDLNPDIVHIHWICEGFIPIKLLSKIKSPIIWTLHDSWGFTGGCHIPYDCGRYRSCCGECPQLGSKHALDLSKIIFCIKEKIYKRLSLTIVSPSNWLAGCAINSKLLADMRIEVIPNGLDLSLYKPIRKNFARQLFNLPEDKLLILFSASSVNDTNKGFHFLQSALHILQNRGWGDKIELIIVGAGGAQEKLSDISYKTNYLGTIKDEIGMILLFNAADVFVAPSIQENLPNTVMEALACGCPCVAFNIGGMPDMIEHNSAGYLAKPFETEDLARGIEFVLSEEDRLFALSYNGRAKTEKDYDINYIADKYINLYKEVII